jgi:hypothetical protein
VFVEPFAVGAVELLNVIGIPGRKEFEKRTEVNGLFAIYVFEGRVEAAEKGLVCGPMLAGSGKALLVEKLFFALKVHLGELDEAFELQGDFAAIGSADEYEAQFVERVHQNTVLIIHCLDAHDAVVTPRQLRHIFLQN